MPYDGITNELTAAEKAVNTAMRAEHRVIMERVRADDKRRLAEWWAEAERDVPPIEERLAVRVPWEAVNALGDFYDARPERACSAFALGWDLCRQLGDEGEDFYRTWAFDFDDATPEEAQAEWASFDRPRLDSDILLLDQIDSAMTLGAIMPAEVAAPIERLHEGVSARRAEREGRHEAELQMQLDQIGSGATHNDFVAYMPAHTYIFIPTREMWPAPSVNARLAPILVPGRDKPLAANAWLDINRPVEQMTWAPGERMEIRDRLIAEGGWIARPGCAVFNLYRPPSIRLTPGDASPWINHAHYVFGDDAEHIIAWLAHRVQRPHEKINHALVLGGAQGIGKDTLLEPVKQVIGPWNFSEVSPQHMLGRFNGFLKSVILRVSEARDLGDTDRFAFYDHAKTYTAAPPDVLRVDEKHLREHSVLNVVGVIITTNHKSDGIYLPPDDRRHFVAWSARTKDDFRAEYWNEVYRWFAAGGIEIVAHYLAGLDLGDFDPKAPPPKTQAFWEIVDASRAPEDAELADTLDRLGRPAATTLTAIAATAPLGFREWLNDRKNRRRIPHRLDECGYVPVRNESAKDGLWIIGGKRQAVYVRKELCLRDQIAAATQLGNR